MTHDTTTRISLTAREGEPLTQDPIREMVIATAHAIAERQGVKVLSIEATSDRLIALLATGRIEAIGFAAELRRLTTSWYTRKYGEKTLWGEPPEDEYDAGEDWKTA